MKILRLPSTDPYLNLATEEYLFDHFKDDFFLLWQNAHTIVVGRHQQTLAEIDMKIVEKEQINVVRRMTGGGTVFHDLGNLNFSFIRTTERNLKSADIFKEFTQPVVSALKAWKLNAEMDGRNDILIEGKKVSGNALMVKGNRVLEHGTLLVNADLGILSSVLTPKKDKFQGKAVQSVSSRVCNIQDFMEEPVSIDQLCAHILAHVKMAFPSATEHQLTQTDQQAITSLKNNKYVREEWNFGRSPSCSYEKTSRTSAGSICAHMLIEGKQLKQIWFSGDFFSTKDPEVLSDLLTDCTLSREAITSRIASVRLEDYFAGISSNEFLDLLV